MTANQKDFLDIRCLYCILSLLFNFFQDKEVEFVVFFFLQPEDMEMKVGGGGRRGREQIFGISQQNRIVYLITFTIPLAIQSESSVGIALIHPWPLVKSSSPVLFSTYFSWTILPPSEFCHPHIFPFSDLLSTCLVSHLHFISLMHLKLNMPNSFLPMHPRPPFAFCVLFFS